MFIKIKAKDLQGEDKEITINTNMIAFLVEDYVHMANSAAFSVDDDTMKELELAVLPKERSKNSAGPDEKLNNLFNKLHTLVGGKGKVTFSLIREKKLKELMGKHRLTEEDLLKAAENIGKDDFLQGRDPENKKRYGDVDYLLRPDKAAKWAAHTGPEKKKSMF